MTGLSWTSGHGGSTAARTELLLRLAGQVPDELITRARTMLARGDLSYVPDTVTLAAVENEVALTAEEVAVLREMLAALGGDGDPTGADAVAITTVTPATGHGFSPGRGARARPDGRRSR